MAIEAGSAYVTLIPSLRGFSARMRSGVNPAALAAGTAAGLAFSSRFSRDAGKSADKELPKELRKAGQAGGLAAGEAAGQSFGARFKERFSTQIKIAASLAGVAATAYAKSAITAASDAEQNMGAVESVFKAKTKTIIDASKRAATEVGLAGNEYRELATLLGTGIKNKGITDFTEKAQGLVKVGADLSSMYGGSTKEAVEAIGSALRGETDPIERYGISMNEAALKAAALSKGLITVSKDSGAIKVAAEKASIAQRQYAMAVQKHGKESIQAQKAQLGLTKANQAFAAVSKGKVDSLSMEQKAQAAIALIYDQSADALGTWNREQDTYAHKMQVFKASMADYKELLGAQLLPAASAFAGVMAEKVMPVLTDVTSLLFTGDTTGGLTKIFGPETAATISSSIAVIRGYMIDFQTALADFDWGNSWESLKTIVVPAIGALGDAFKRVDIEATTASFSDGMRLLTPFANMAGAALGFLADHAEDIAKWVPVMLAGAAAMRLFSKTFGPDAVPGIILRTALTIAQVVANYKLAKSMDAVADAQRKQTGTDTASLLSKAKQAAATAVQTIKNGAHAASVKLQSLFTKNHTREVATNTAATNGNALAQGRAKLAAIASTVATKAMTVAQKALNVVLRMNPIGLVITAIGLLVGALIYLYKNNETVRKAIDKAWASLREAGSRLAKWIGEKVGDMGRNWDSFKKRLVTICAAIVIGPFKGLIDGAQGVWSFFGSMKDGVIELFNKMGRKLQEITSWIGKHVIDPLVNAWNTVAKFTGQTAIKWAGIGFASGGWTGPGAKYKPAGVVHADEYVLRKEATNKLRDRIGLKGLDHMNRTGELPDSERPGPMMGGRTSPIRGKAPADQGVWRQMITWLRQNVPGARVTSAYRRTMTATGKVSNHARGLALDIVGSGRTSLMEIFEKIRAAHGARSIELIHSQAGGRQLYRGKPHNYSGVTRANHFDHVHWSVPSLTGVAPFTGSLDSGGGGGAPAWWGLVSKLFDGARGAVDKVSGLFGNNDYVKMVSALAKKPVDAVESWLMSKFGGGTLPDAAAAPGSGAVVDQVKAAAAKHGWGDGAQWDAIKWIVGKESSWNPNAKNPKSTAYGLFQFLNGTWGSTGIGKTSNPGLQAEAAMRYFKQRYKSPLGAQQFWKNNGYYADGGLVKPKLYDTGGILHPGLTLVSNQTGKPETVRTHEQEQELRRALSKQGGDTFNINGIKHDSTGEFAEALSYTMTLRDNRRKYRKG